MRCLLVVLLLALPATARADAVALRWADLIPADARLGPEQELKQQLGLGPDDPAPASRGVIGHGQRIHIPGGGDRVVTHYAGRTVTLTGFAIPLDYTAEGATSFMLAPYVGACIHVPPPPPNQLVFVTTAKPVRIDELFQAFAVTGTLGTASAATRLTEVGYTLVADTVEPFAGTVR